MDMHIGLRLGGKKGNLRKFRSIVLFLVEYKIIFKVLGNEKEA